MAEACYKERYLPASFKGVPFPATVVTSSHGRRGAAGEFVFSEETAFTDTGRKIRRYTAEAAFRENAHILQAQALILACDSPGPGRLVHPTRGIIQAVCLSCEVSDDLESAGETTVSLEFIEAETVGNGVQLLGGFFGVNIAPVLEAAQTVFASLYVVGGIQSFRKSSVVGSAQRQADNIRRQYSLATVGKAQLASRSRILYDFDHIIGDENSAADTESMQRTLALGMNAVSQETFGSNKFDVFREIGNGAAITPSFAAPAGEAEAAIYSLVRVGSAAFMTEGVLEDDDQRTNQVLTRMNTVKTYLDEEMEYASSRCLNHYYESLHEFRSTSLNAMRDKAYNSPGVVKYNFGGSVHPLVAAYSIHGDAKRHQEMQNLNDIQASGRFNRQVLAVNS